MKKIVSYSIGEEVGRNGARFADLGELEQSAGNGFHHDEAGLGSAEMVSSGTGVDSGQFISQKGTMVGVGALGHGHFDNWADSGVVADHSQQTDTSTDTDDKNQALRRLAQNREAARKSRMRKKAYVQQLENSRLKLTQLEQDLKRARSRALAQNRTYFTCFPACGKLHERCFMWLGGFRCSEILKILGNQIEPLTEQQLVGICNLQQSSQQAEDALSQGMEALQQSLVETLSSNSLGPRNSGNVADYMGQMAIAMSKLATLENFLHQADLLRQQTLQQLQRILTTRQAARALLAISDYRSRLRALSSLWLARPKE
ncbi:hypothetical protein DH2020_032223 [Rehmannia glutinosa]|uniref:Uncharacterized protein n=1 Tax=Rehmannia glutinosa TaxID=99300 RepID=A0ABR0VJC0_REHGL